jgi:hypothetical protein
METIANPRIREATTVEAPKMSFLRIASPVHLHLRPAHPLRPANRWGFKNVIIGY